MALRPHAASGAKFARHLPLHRRQLTRARTATRPCDARARRTSRAAAAAFTAARASARTARHDASATPNGAANTVYRSGVIDGMAYTLFMDGSIQAELPHGMVKFASVDELQKYLLEKR